MSEYNTAPLYTEGKEYSNTNDYVTFNDYHHSFFAAPRLSDLRRVIVPGALKNFNQSFSREALLNQDTSVLPYTTDVSLLPIPLTSDLYKKEWYDYLSYPKDTDSF